MGAGPEGRSEAVQLLVEAARLDRRTAAAIPTRWTIAAETGSRSTTPRDGARRPVGHRALRDRRADPQDDDRARHESAARRPHINSICVVSLCQGTRRPWPVVARRPLRPPVPASARLAVGRALKIQRTTRASTVDTLTMRLAGRHGLIHGGCRRRCSSSCTSLLGNGRTISTRSTGWPRRRHANQAITWRSRSGVMRGSDRRQACRPARRPHPPGHQRVRPLFRARPRNERIADAWRPARRPRTHTRPPTEGPPGIRSTGAASSSSSRLEAVFTLCNGGIDGSEPEVERINGSFFRGRTRGEKSEKVRSSLNHTGHSSSHSSEHTVRIRTWNDGFVLRACSSPPRSPTSCPPESSNDATTRRSAGRSWWPARFTTFLRARSARSTPRRAEGLRDAAACWPWCSWPARPSASWTRPALRGGVSWMASGCDGGKC